MLADLDAQLTASLDAAWVPGAQAALVKDGAVVWAGDYGERDASTGESVTPDTSFALASVSKTVTAVALLQAYETGAFELDDPIAPFLSFTVEHPRSDTAITFRHLLTHTSGIRDDWSVLDEGYAPGDPVEPLADFLERVLDPEGADYSPSRSFTTWGPGEGFTYSNVGAALAGHMVEAVTGTDFAQWCDERIFEPLGMAHTSWKLAGLDEALVAHPHLCYATCRSLEHYGYPDYPDGLLRSSAVDMGRFMAAVTRGGELDGVRLLEEATVEEILRVQAPSGQGLIWYEQPLGADIFIGHNGGDMGVSTEMFFRRDDGTGFVLWMSAEPRGWSHVLDMERALIAAADLL